MKVLAIFFLILISINAFSLEFDTVKDNSIDLNSVDVLTQSEALKEIGSFYKGNDQHFKYWNASILKDMIEFTYGFECSLGDCFNRKNIYIKNKYGHESLVEQSYSFGTQAENFVSILNTILKKAKENDFGIILAVTNYNDTVKVYFVEI